MMSEEVERFSAHVDESGDSAILRLAGDLDLATISEARAELYRAEASMCRRVVIDLTEVSFIDSSGLLFLLEAHRRFASSDRLRVSGARDQVADVLRMTSIDEILPTD